MPQCRGCGIIYKALKGPICGHCLSVGVAVEDTFEEEFSVTDEPQYHRSNFIFILIFFCVLMTI